MYDYKGQKLNRPITERLILELFAGKIDVKKAEIKSRVLQEHSKRGGKPHTTQTTPVTAALKTLRDKGLANNEKRGYWTFKVKETSVNEILSGDCLNILPSFPDGVFDCCITDPPFNMSKNKGLGWAFSSHVTMQEKWDTFSEDDYFQFTVNWITEVLRVLKTNGNLFVFGSFHCIFTIGFILQKLFDRRIISQIVWYKPNAQPNITCRMFTESTEFIIWAVNNESKKAKNWTFNYDMAKAMNNDKQMRNMWEIPLTKPSEREHGKHPSQKPIAVINRLILTGTNEGDLILDPFSGTGTTAVVAQQHKRRWVMIEKDETYNQIAKERLGELFQC